jgi:hypothetical protein
MRLTGRAACKSMSRAQEHLNLARFALHPWDFSMSSSLMPLLLAFMLPQVALLLMGTVLAASLTAFASEPVLTVKKMIIDAPLSAR